MRHFLSNRKALWSLLCRVAVFDRYELICAVVIEQLQFIVPFHRNQLFTKKCKKKSYVTECGNVKM